MVTQKHKHRSGYLLVVLLVLVLAVYVWRGRKEFKQEQYVVTLVQQYARDRQQQGEGDNIEHNLLLPSEAPPEIRCIVSILEKEQSCPEEVYQSSRYDKGAVSLLQGMMLWSSAQGTGDLLSGYYALHTATEEFEASRAAKWFGWISGVASVNEKVAQAGHYGIAIDFLVTYGNILQAYAKELTETLDAVLVHISAIQTRLGMLKPTTSDAQICIETLKKAMTTSQRTTTDLRAFVEDVKQIRVKQYIRNCLVSPHTCVEEQEKQLGSVASGLTAMQQGANQYLIIYSELINGLLQNPQKTLEELCSGKSQIDNTQARHQIEEGINALNPQKQQGNTSGGEQQSGSAQSGSAGSANPSDEGPPRGINQIPLNEYQKEYLKEMYDRQREYLQQRKELQQDPGFSPKGLLRQLFEEFYGNEDEFE